MFFINHYLLVAIHSGSWVAVLKHDVIDPNKNIFYLCSEFAASDRPGVTMQGGRHRRSAATTEEFFDSAAQSIRFDFWLRGFFARTKVSNQKLPKLWIPLGKFVLAIQISFENYKNLL